MNLLLTLLPDEAMPLVIAAIGLCVVLGLRSAAGLLPSILLAAVLAPVIALLLEGMPPIVSILLFTGFLIWATRALFNLVLGRAAADHMVGTLAAGAVRGLFALVFGLPLLILRSVFGALARSHNSGGPR